MSPALQQEASEGVKYHDGPPATSFTWGVSDVRVAGCLADLAGARGDAREAQARLEQLARDHSSRELSALQQMRVRLQRMLCACAQLRRDRAERARARTRA